jgi:formamidopyrimidine-DNA glycosylase
MPELPDVEGFKRYLDSTSLHQVVKTATVFDERVVQGVSPATLRGRVEGSELTGSRRHGKYLFAGLSGGGDLVLHFGMTGSLEYRAAPGPQPEHVRFSLRFTNGAELSYVNVRRLGRISYTDDPADFIEEHELGPDALDDGLDRAAFVRAFRGRTGSIKAALMNQSILAGIGNEYSDEILFQTGIDPRTPVNKLSENTLGDMYGVMRRVMRTAADHGGAVAELPRKWLLPRLQSGDDACPCGGTVEKATVSGRTAHFCPECQKRF